MTAVRVSIFGPKSVILNLLNMRRRFVFFFFSACVTASLFAAPTPAWSAAPRVFAKPHLLEYLRSWETSLAGRAMDDFERDLEREFILRLRFQVERRYVGDDASLTRILAFLLELEEQPQNRSLSYTTTYIRELLQAIKLIREPNENLVVFMRQFTEAAGIKNAMSAEAFLRSRAYVNGQQSATAREFVDEAWDELADTIYDQEFASVDKPERPVGPGMPRPDPAIPSLSPSAEVALTDEIDAELLAELQADTTDETAALEPAGQIQPPAAQSLRSSDEAVRLR